MAVVVLMKISNHKILQNAIFKTLNRKCSVDFSVEKHAY